MAAKQNNTLIGRKCVIDFACRWKTARPEFQEQMRLEYATRDDWNKTGEIVSFDPVEQRVMVLRDDTGSLDEYYKGEVTITGPAPNPQAQVVDLLQQILAQLIVMNPPK